MIEEIITMFLWSIITFVLLIKEAINVNFAYVGMCLMLVAGLLHKEDA